MLYERAGFDHNGDPLSFSVTDSGDYLTIVKGEDTALVHFDFLVHDEIKIALADAFFDQGYSKPRDYLYFAGFPVEDSKIPGEIEFSADDALFVRALQAYGIDISVATHVSFYSIDFTGEGFSSEREEFLEHFMEQKLGLRMENKGTLKGFTTFDLYLLIASRSSRMLADYLTKKAYGVPSVIAASADSLSILMRSGVAVEELSTGQIGALTAVVTSNFPVARFDGKRPVLVGGIANFLSQDHDFKIAARELRKRSSFKTELSHELMRFIDYSNPNSYGDQNLGNEHTLALASIFISTYGAEFMEQALVDFKTHEPFLNMNSPYVFATFVAYVQHLALGGEKDVAIHWIITLDPTIEDDSVINRGE